MVCPLRKQGPRSWTSTPESFPIRLDGATIDYFKGLSEGTGIPYQNLYRAMLHPCHNHSAVRESIADPVLHRQDQQMIFLQLR
jgi:hypothetical protein